MSLALACIRALCFISFVRAQLSKQQVALESVTSLKPTSGSTALAIPPSPNALAVSVALCASSSLSTRFFVTNNTQQSPADIISNGGGDGSWEIFLTDGYGNWTGSAQNGALVVFGGTDVSLEVVVSSNGELALLD
jgi:calcium channel MID1